MRVFSHTQCLSGVGHFVRAREIAYAVAARHTVYLVDGGWRIPRGRPPADVTFVEVPRIGRVRGRLEALDDARSLEATIADRIRRLERTVRDLRPDVVLIEQYPFDTWTFEAEFQAVIAAARAVNSGVKVIASVREFVEKAEAEDRAVPGQPYAQRVLAALAPFDAVFVHADPRFTRFEDHVGWSGNPPLPVVYTGFVAEPVAPFSGGRRDLLAWLDRRRLVMASAGGSDRGGGFFRAAITAWLDLAGAGHVAGHALLVCAALRSTESEIGALRQLAGDEFVRVEPFMPDFLEWLAVADLSISRPGYNTCMNVLATRRRALLVPDSGMPDQVFRAGRFGELGWADVLRDERPGAFAEAIVRALQRPEPMPDVALDGGARTRCLLEAL
jgi:predicted glycosyltransferase